MEFNSYTAGTDDDGKRLDRILKSLFMSLPSQETERKEQTNIYQALRKKLIKVNGEKAEPSKRIRTGDTIEIANFLKCSPSKHKPFPQEHTVSPFPFEILYQNDDLLFINKPSGINVQPSTKSDISISQYVQAAHKYQDNNASLSFIPSPLHRLDRYTSGILAISKSAHGAEYFSKAIQKHEIKKTYIGICQGIIKKEEFWEDYIEKEPSSKENSFHKVKISSKEKGKLAQTLIKPLCIGNSPYHEISLVEYSISTGRKHQIRIQSSIHGHPLYADTAYGGHPSTNCHFFLHALSLTFPVDNPLSLPTRLEAPIPALFTDFICRTFDREKLANFFDAKYNRLRRI